MWERTNHPLWFQGVRKRTNYFEGWYYKQVSADGRTTLSLIPGISRSKAHPHAFLHVILAQDGFDVPKTWYLAFPTEAFSFSDQPFHVAVDQNRFGVDRIDLSVSRDELSLTGSIALGEGTPIRKTGMYPTIMGPFAYVPLMECYHGVVSMDHAVSGTVVLNGETISFDGGKGYLEKDWGASFPKEYVWLQTNHFPIPGTSLMASVARIPFLGMTFSGFLVNFVHDGKEHRFATYNGAKAKKLESTADETTYLFTRRKWTLWLKAKSRHAAALPAPKNGSMDHAIKEGLSGTVDVRLSGPDGILFEGKGLHAGIEIATLEKWLE